VAQLAGSDGRTDPLAYVIRAAREACGALTVLLMRISSTDATPIVVRAHGRSATRVWRKLTALEFDWLGTSLRAVDAAGYRILVVPVTTPAGVVGALAVGVRHRMGSRHASASTCAGWPTSPAWQSRRAARLAHTVSQEIGAERRRQLGLEVSR